MKFELPRIDKKEKVGEFPDKFNQVMEKLETSINEFDGKIDSTLNSIEKMNKRLEDLLPAIIFQL